MPAGNAEECTGSVPAITKFVDVVRDLHDPMPYLRGIIAELGFDYKAIEYTQPKRRAGKSKNNFYSLYDYAMIGITSYSKVVMRLATFTGFIIGGLSMVAAIVYLVLKLLYWDRFSAGVAPMVIGMFFLGSLQLFFIGFLGEYVLSINKRVIHRPLVVVEKTINFDGKPVPMAGTTQDCVVNEVAYRHDASGSDNANELRMGEQEKKKDAE